MKVKRIRLMYRCRCLKCERWLEKDEIAYWHSSLLMISCPTCTIEPAKPKIYR